MQGFCCAAQVARWYRGAERAYRVRWLGGELWSDGIGAQPESVRKEEAERWRGEAAAEVAAVGSSFRATKSNERRYMRANCQRIHRSGNGQCCTKNDRFRCIWL